MVTLRVRSAALVGLLVLSPVLAHATVYSWRSDDGVLMVSNNPEDVPEDKRASARTFTSKPAPKPVRDEEAASGAAAALDAYQRGFERGLEAAERQVEFAERLAAAIPQAAPVPIVIQQPAPAAPYDEYPGYDNPAAFYPYPPYVLGYSPFFVGGRFGARRHFFPGVRVRGRHFGPPFSHVAFGRMR